MRVLEKSVTLASTKLVPEAELFPFVRHVRVVPPQANSGRYVRLPDGELELTLQLREGSLTLNAVGARAHALDKVVAGEEWVFAVRFRPGGAYPFFGTRISELTDQIVPLDALWGRDAKQLEEAIERGETREECGRILQTALVARLRSRGRCQPASVVQARRALQLLEDATELPTVEQLAAGVELSARQLRRAFDDVVGISPKIYTRIVRFRRALREATRVNAPSWSEIAASAGYWDQAHLIAEFKDLAGTTPGAWATSHRRGRRLR
jgi:AraC-like DNA-binding protein